MPRPAGSKNVAVSLTKRRVAHKAAARGAKAAKVADKAKIGYTQARSIVARAAKRKAPTALLRAQAVALVKRTAHNLARTKYSPRGSHGVSATPWNTWRIVQPRHVMARLQALKKLSPKLVKGKATPHLVRVVVAGIDRDKRIRDRRVNRSKNSPITEDQWYALERMSRNW